MTTNHRRTVVVTGASSGIGKGIALRLAEKGDFNIVVAARRTAVIEALAKECGSNALAVTTDVGKADDMERLRDAAITRFGRIDIWINNAGIGAAGNFTDVPLRDHIKTVETTFLGTLNGTYVAMAHFEKNGAGHVINIASLAGKIPLPWYSSYSAAKFGAVGLGKALFRELQSRGVENIHISTINAWVVDTPWFDHAGNYTGHTLRMPLADDASNVINVVMNVIDKPVEEVGCGQLRR